MFGYGAWLSQSAGLALLAMLACVTLSGAKTPKDGIASTLLKNN